MSAALVTGSAALVLPYYIGEKVVEVVDGDTFFISNRQPIRLYGVDAPELTYAYGQQAKTALTKLVLGKRVILREPLSDGRGRVMALVYVDGKLVNEYLVKNGLAVYRRQAGSETQVMKAANAYARENHLGIFAPDCYQFSPPDPKCPVKGNIDDRTREKLYIPVGCPVYNQVVIEKNMGETWFCSENQALKAGFSKSPSCR